MLLFARVIQKTHFAASTKLVLEVDVGFIESDRIVRG
jgi:hypothetical protein